MASKASTHSESIDEDKLDKRPTTSESESSDDTSTSSSSSSSDDDEDGKEYVVQQDQDAENDQNDGVLNAAAFLDQQKCGLSICGLHVFSTFLEHATHGKFLLTLCLLGIAEGIIQGYTVSFLHENTVQLSSSVLRGLLLSSGFIQIVFTFLIGFTGGRRHKPTWIANTTIFIWVSAICISLILAMHIDWSRYQSNFSSKGSPLCELRSDINMFAWNKNFLLILFLFVLQVGVGLSNVSFMSLGLPYLDDNIGPWRSPIFIGTALAAKCFGPQLGHIILSLNISTTVPFFFFFSTSFWIVSGLLLMVISLILTMFPHKLLPLHDNDSQLSIANNRARRSSYSTTGFRGAIQRILNTKMIVYNALASMCLHTVETNFSDIRSSYLQTVFYIPSSMEFITSIQHRFITDFLRMFVVALVLIFSGYLIKKHRPVAKTIASWNMIAVIFAIFIIFITFTLKCQRTRLYSNYNNSLDDFCNKGCYCDTLSFLPVCSPDGSTMYYSPCHAGCKVLRNSSLDLYGNCHCVATEKASSTYCHKDFCLFKSLVFQLLDLIMSALLVSCRVGSMLLCFRCVNSKDKPVVVSFEIFLSMIFAYIPGKFLYSLALSESCVLQGDNIHHCKVFNAESLATYVNILNLCFLIAGVGFYSVVYSSVSHISLFGEEVKPQIMKVRKQLSQNNNNNTNLNGNHQNNGTPTNQSVPKAKSILVKPTKLPITKDADIFVNCNNPELEPLFSNINEKPLQSSPAKKRDVDIDSNSDRSSGITVRKGGFLTTLL